MYPAVTTTAKPTAEFRRRGLKRGLFQPTLSNRLHPPWKGWMPTAMHTAMYANATGTRSEGRDRVPVHLAPRTYPGIRGAPGEVEDVEHEEAFRR